MLVIWCYSPPRSGSARPAVRGGLVATLTREAVEKIPLAAILASWLRDQKIAMLNRRLHRPPLHAACVAAPHAARPSAAAAALLATRSPPPLEPSTKPASTPAAHARCSATWRHEQHWPRKPSPADCSAWHQPRDLLRLAFWADVEDSLRLTSTGHGSRRSQLRAAAGLSTCRSQTGL